MLIGESWEYMGDMYHFDCSKEAYGIYWLIIEITDGHTNTYSLVYVELAHISKRPSKVFFLPPHYRHVLQSQTASLIRQVNSIYSGTLPQHVLKHETSTEPKAWEIIPYPFPFKQ